MFIEGGGHSEKILTNRLLAIEEAVGCQKGEHIFIELP